MGGRRRGINDVRGAGIQIRRSAHFKSDKCIFRTTSSWDDQEDDCSEKENLHILVCPPLSKAHGVTFAWETRTKTRF